MVQNTVSFLFLGQDSAGRTDDRPPPQKFGFEPRSYIGGYNFVLSQLTALTVSKYRWNRISSPTPHGGELRRDAGHGNRNFLYQEAIPATLRAFDYAQATQLPSRLCIPS
jgi:hypothetical protein